MTKLSAPYRLGGGNVKDRVCSSCDGEKKKKPSSKIFLHWRTDVEQPGGFLLPLHF